MRTYENSAKPLQIGIFTINNRFRMAPLDSSQHHLSSGGQKVGTILHAVWDGYEVSNNI